MSDYVKRICDDELELKLEAFGAVHIVGPKWCGKTTTAKQFAKSYIEMQDPDKRDMYICDFCNGLILAVWTCNKVLRKQHSCGEGGVKAKWVSVINCVSNSKQKNSHVEGIGNSPKK